MEAQVLTDGQWRLLSELESWLESPVVVLSIAWVAIVILELTGSTNDLLTG